MRVSTSPSPRIYRVHYLTVHGGRKRSPRRCAVWAAGANMHSTKAGLAGREKTGRSYFRNFQQIASLSSAYLRPFRQAIPTRNAPSDTWKVFSAQLHGALLKSCVFGPDTPHRSGISFQMCESLRRAQSRAPRLSAGWYASADPSCARDCCQLVRLYPPGRFLLCYFEQESAARPFNPPYFTLLRSGAT